MTSFATVPCYRYFSQDEDSDEDVEDLSHQFQLSNSQISQKRRRFSPFAAVRAVGFPVANARRTGLQAIAVVDIQNISLASPPDPRYFVSSNLVLSSTASFESRRSGNISLTLMCPTSPN
ncbi:Phenazine biosynthesis protein A/B [Phytophthora cactorum]|nr:Phenazine biosynthesis protein A/B [Phytophthora cactorum]